MKNDKYRLYADLASPRRERFIQCIKVFITMFTIEGYSKFDAVALTIGRNYAGLASPQRGHFAGGRPIGIRSGYGPVMVGFA